jgi:hypothetical protein
MQAVLGASGVSVSAALVCMLVSLQAMCAAAWLACAAWEDGRVAAVYVQPHMTVTCCHTDLWRILDVCARMMHADGGGVWGRPLRGCVINHSQQHESVQPPCAIVQSAVVGCDVVVMQGLIKALLLRYLWGLLLLPSNVTL